MEFEFDLTPLNPSSRTERESDYDYEDPFAEKKEPTDVYDEDDEFNDDYVFGFTDAYKTKTQTGPLSVFDRIHTKQAVTSLSQDESTTFHAMLNADEKAEVFVMPTHRIDTVGEMCGNQRGFRLVVSADADCVNLPVTRDMFKGSTCVECDPGDRDIHPDVIRLLSDPAAVRASVLKVLAAIQKHDPATLVSLDHMPIAVDTEVPTVTLDDQYTGRERNDMLLDYLIAERIGRFSTTMRGRDSRAWQCDMPSSVGVYHAYVRSRDTGKREHKLFIVASGGCRRASEQFYNMNLDLLGDATAGELESCEETWWLRRISTRSRCMTIKLIAEALHLAVPMITDQFAYEDHVAIPVYTTDTLHNDISLTDDGRVALFNSCVDTTSVTNGILCTQHHSEGMWMFLGSQQSSVGNLSNFGGGFGDQTTCGAFPTSTFAVYEESHVKPNGNSTHTNQNQTQDTRLNLYHERGSSRHVLYYNALTGEEILNEAIDFENHPKWLKFDAFLIEKLVSHGWNRNWDIMQLIPIINAVEI
jgi:hypothetical protein